MGYLGAIVGGVIGAVLTYFTWDPQYVYYGWTIGAALGSAIEEASKGTLKIEGPKASDLTVQVATYGGMVPIHFGTVGVTGTVIDLDKITAHSDKNYVKAQKAYVTTYTYTTTVAILLGEGVCLGVRKIWLDGKLWYSSATDANVETIVASSQNTSSVAYGHALQIITLGLGFHKHGSTGPSFVTIPPKFKFYPGTETQLPDPTLEAIHGVGNVPAYRGVSYVVISNNAEILNGNRLRQLKFELVYSGSMEIVHRNWAKGPASQAGTYVDCGVQSFIPNGSDEIILMKQTTAVTGFASSYEVWSITPTAQTLISKFALPDMAYPYRAIAGSADEFGHLRPWVSNPAYVFQGVYRWIYPDGTFVNFYTGVDFYSFNPVAQYIFSKQGDNMLLLGAHASTSTTFVLVKLFKMDGSLVATRDFTADLGANESIKAVVLATSCAWVISEDITTGISTLRKCSLLDLSAIATITYIATDPIPGGVGETYGILFHGLEEVCLGGDDFYVRTNIGNALYGHFILKVDPNGVISIEGSDGLVLGTPADGGIGPDILATGGVSVGAQVDLYGSAFGYNPSSRVATFMCNENLSPNFYIWPYSVALGAIASGTTTAGEIISTIAQRAGYTPDQLDVSQIPDTVLGYSIASIAPARSAIEPVAKYAYSDPVDSDGKTKWVKRGGPPLFTVYFDDLCAHEIGAQMPEPFSFSRTQEVDLPSKVIVNFKNPLADYEPGSEQSPQRSTTSKNPVTDSMPIVMLPQKAAELASVLYFDQIIQRQPRTFSVLKKFDYVEPTDPGWVEWPRGTFNLVRVVKRVENGPVLKFDCVPEDADAYTPNVTATSIATGQAGIVLVGPSTLTLLDIPILQDSDDNAGLYAAMAGASNKGTSLFRSADDLSYAELSFVENSAITGFATSALGNWAGGNVFDDVNTIDVYVNGTLTSATEAAILAAPTLNAYVIGVQGAEELGQFTVATQLSAGKYRLSGLLRGQRGTEWAMGMHTSSDQFVLLGSGGTLRPDEGTSALGATRYYKAVSLGRSLVQTYGQQFINTGVGLKPFSPVNMTWGVNAAGDYMIYAQRRSRLQERQGMFWDLPLGEVSELYDVEIYSDAGYTMLKHTFSNQTGFPITYTVAMQTADFGVAVTLFYVKIYQRSAVVGRGYPLSSVVNNVPAVIGGGGTGGGGTYVSGTGITTLAGVPIVTLIGDPLITE